MNVLTELDVCEGECKLLLFRRGSLQKQGMG